MDLSVFGFTDSFHIAEPILSDTPLTAWVMAPMYAVGYGLVLLVIELVRKHRKSKNKMLDFMLSMHININKEQSITTHWHVNLCTRIANPRLNN